MSNYEKRSVRNNHHGFTYFVGDNYVGNYLEYCCANNSEIASCRDIVHDCELEIQKAQTNLIDNSSGCVFVTFKTSNWCGNVSGAKIIFFSDSGQEVKDVSGRLNEQEWKKFDVCLTNPNVTGLRVYPLLISDEGESVTGKIYDEVGKVAGSASVEPSCTPQCSGKVCGNDGCGGSCGTCGSGQCVEGVCSLVKEISGCSILNESGTTYMLNQSISDMLYFSNCIRIVADNITLDCN
jgi:hypothetical protein